MNITDEGEKMRGLDGFTKPVFNEELNLSTSMGFLDFSKTIIKYYKKEKDGRL